MWSAIRVDGSHNADGRSNTGIYWNLKQFSSLFFWVLDNLERVARLGEDGGIFIDRDDSNLKGDDG